MNTVNTHEERVLSKELLLRFGAQQIRPVAPKDYGSIAHEALSNESVTQESLHKPLTASVGLSYKRSRMIAVIKR